MGAPRWRQAPSSAHLGGSNASLQVSGDEEVDDRSADPLGGQDEGQGPPEAQHLLDGGVALPGKSDG